MARLEQYDEALRQLEASEEQKKEIQDSLNKLSEGTKIDLKELMGYFVRISAGKTNKDIQWIMSEVVGLSSCLIPNKSKKKRSKGKNKSDESSVTSPYLSPFHIDNGAICKDEAALTNFHFEILHEIKNIDNNTVEYESNLICNEKSNPFNINDETLSNNREFEIALRRAGAGLQISFNPKDMADIRHAFTDAMQENPDFEKMIITSKMGWYTNRELCEKLKLSINEDDPTIDIPIYVTKSSIIGIDGISKNDRIRIEISENLKARFLDIPSPAYVTETDTYEKSRLLNEEEENFKKAGHHFCDDVMKLHDPYVMRMKITDHFMSSYTSRMREMVGDEAEYPSCYYGSGHGRQGKTFIDMRLMNLHGSFSDDKNLITWGSKIAAIEEQGSYCNDVPFLVDDMRRSYIGDLYSQGEFDQFLHNHVAGVGKGRHSRSGYPSTPTRGHLIINSENKLTFDPSNEGRMCNIFVPDRPKEMERGKRCIEMQKYYSLFKCRFIMWIEQGRQPTKEKYEVYRDEFNREFGSGADLSKPKIYAIRYLWYEKFCEFMNAYGFISNDNKAKELAEFKHQIVEHGKQGTIALIESEPANVLIRLINVALQTGDAIILELGKDPKDVRKPIVGKILESGNIAIIPEKAIEITKLKSLYQFGVPFSASKDDLTNAFIEKNLLVEKNRDSNYKTVNFTGIEGLKSQRQGSWVFNKSLFGHHEDEVTIQDKVNLIPACIEMAVTNFNLLPVTKPDEAQKQEIRTSIYNHMHLTEKQIDEYSEIIEVAMRAYYKGKGWSWNTLEELNEKLKIYAEKDK